ncbi:MAG: mannose-1-phosphate guanylyltransferase/mannose-6-phosphate isomerase [Geminicoccaceae bacterium]
MTAILPVILAGGAGTRLWPVSRETMPKHLADIIGEASLLQLTATRLMAEAPADRLITVAAKHQDLLIRRQLEAVDPALASHRLLEPVGRNTAAAIALAALYAEKTFGGEAVLWVCPSDHLIRDEAALSDAVKHALPAAAGGDLVTFGIQPTRPETGYGYIRAGTPAGVDLPERGGAAASPIRKVERFVEKPDLETAKGMLAEGNYLWNSGMFLFRADRIIEELAEHEPLILEATEMAFANARRHGDGSIQASLELYEKIPSMPIDKAVMERASRIAVVPCDPDWTDLGSWHAIWEISAKDGNGNAARGDVLLHEAENCLVHAASRLVTCAGVQDLAVIETGDAVLVVDRNRSEPVKALVADLNAAGRSETQQHQTVDQTWGQATFLDSSGDAEVRKLEILPGEMIENAEGAMHDLHWLVLAGSVEFERSDEHVRLEAGDSADLAAGTAYRLDNKGASPARLLEVGQLRRQRR